MIKTYDLYCVCQNSYAAVHNVIFSVFFLLLMKPEIFAAACLSYLGSYDLCGAKLQIRRLCCKTHSCHVL